MQTDNGGMIMLSDDMEKSESSQGNESWSDMLKNTGSVFSFASDIEPSPDSRIVNCTNTSPTTKSSCLSPPTPKYPRRVCQLKGSIPLHPRINQAYEELKNKRKNQQNEPDITREPLPESPTSNSINHRKWKDFCTGGVVARFQEINANQSAKAFLKSFTSGDFMANVPSRLPETSAMELSLPSTEPVNKDDFISKAAPEKECTEKKSMFSVIFEISAPSRSQAFRNHVF